jgi:hypothetical protein
MVNREMNKNDELGDALALAGQLCTSDQIKELLRKRKGNENVRLSAESKEDLVHRNLREAISAKAMDIDEVFDLIRLAEENGNQHIFYYRPKTRRIAEALSYESVARQLWGSTWEKRLAEFPSIRLKPNDYRYSDFRILPKKPKDWILKIYGQNVVTRFTGKTEQRGSSLWREYVEEPLRIVLSARWNSPDLLEIRVQRNESRRRVEEWRQKVWSMLSPALTLSRFDAWDLKTSMTRIILEHEKHEKIYTFRDASIDDMGVHANFQAYSDEGDLFASQRSIDAIKSYVRAEGDCRGLAVTWLANPNATPQKEIRTLLGAREAGEMIVSGHCLPGDLDHVTDQLRSFSKTAS